MHVLFVGDGEQAQSLKARVRECQLGHRVHMTGYLKAPELKEAYAAMDAALVMQPGNDAAARAALEAMAAGLPIIAPAQDALGELVDAGTGYTLGARTPDAVAQALRLWLADPAQGRARGTRGQRRVEVERSIEREVAATLAVYVRARARVRDMQPSL